MQAYEFVITTTATGELELPATLAEHLPPNQAVRVIVLLDQAASYSTDLTPDEEDIGWGRLGAAAMATQYDEADSIYDQLEVPDASVSGR